MWSSRHLTLVKPNAAANLDSAQVRHSLDTLRRLRSGWRPDERLLGEARRAERWSVSRQGGAGPYQFVGYTGRPAGPSLTIASVLALEPAERWAFLFNDTWIRLGEASPEASPVAAADVASSAEAWLLSLGS
jgi:hypothetical protein